MRLLPFISDTKAALTYAKEAVALVGNSALYLGAGLLTAPGCGDAYEDAAGHVCDSEFISDNLVPAGLTLRPTNDVRGVAIRRTALYDPEVALCLLERVSACADLANDSDFLACVEPSALNLSCSTQLPSGGVTPLVLSAGSSLDLPSDNWTFITDDGDGASLSHLNRPDVVQPFCSSEHLQSATYECLESEDFTLSCNYEVPAAE